MRYMWTTVPTILHDTGAKILEDQDEDLKRKKRKNGSRKPVAEVISREPGPALKNVGEHSETGTIIALLFYDASRHISKASMSLIDRSSPTVYSSLSPLSNSLLHKTRSLCAQVVFVIQVVWLP